MQNTTISTKINFGGFYESIHSYIINDYIEDYEYDFEKVNYKDTYKIYAEDYIKVLNQMLDTNIIFKGLVSPKFYNYSTDFINVEILKKDILKLFEYIRLNGFKQEVFNIIKDSSTSKDGYISFYTYSDYFKKKNLDILLECILDVIVESLQDDIVEDLHSNYLEIVLNNDN